MSGNWQERAGAKAKRVETMDARCKAVESELAARQDAHRLAISLYERTSYYDKGDTGLLVPASLRLDMERNAQFLPALPDREIKKQEVPLISMSQIPGRQSGITIRPHNGGTDVHTLGYVFDLTEAQPNPPVVVRVSDKIEYTGYQRHNKDYLLLEGLIAPNVKEIYKPYSYTEHDSGRTMMESEHRLLNAALRNPAQFAKAMDALGQQYNTGHREPSELLVAASPQHAKALVMPVFEPSCKSEWNQLTDYADFLHLALAGMAHFKEGKGLPIVTYNGGPKLAGGFSCHAVDGQGCEVFAREMAEKLQGVLYPARSSIFNIPQSGKFSPFQIAQFDVLQPAAKEMLGVDILEPSPERGRAL